MTTFDQLASEVVITGTIDALKSHGFTSEVVENAAAAMEVIKSRIPEGASVMDGSSTTLDQIGYVEYLKSGNHGWNNTHATLLAETDTAKQAELRKAATISQYFVNSVHAVTEDGQLVWASNTGSQIPNIAYSSDHAVLVVGTQKIVPDLQSAMQRVEEYVVPKEDARMMEAYKMGTQYNLLLVFKKMSTVAPRDIHVVFVREVLGF
jgi:hypothetical protein